MRAFDGISAIVEQATVNLAALFLSPTSHFSVWSLLSAFGLALAFLLVRRGKPIAFRVALRALLPRRLLTGRSARADWGFLLLNGALGPMLFGWAIVSHFWVAGGVHGALDAALGAQAAIGWPQLAIGLAMSLALFIAYEFGYWFDHWLCHHVPALWEFHKVHHSAETLSPVTNFRVHPVDTLLFYNIVAVTTGVTSGAAQWLFGDAAAPLTLGSVNVLMVAFVFLLLHLQHSQLWIALPGRLGHWILSPAHHQLHHSSDPAHFNSNYGNGLAVWDRLFGTLRMPSARRERLTFGTPELAYDPHGARGALVMPFVDALRSTRAR
jgi:sterol desaturase/sphingolipid hydroxylase (fatty acid hydroxylase superfamily)